MESEIYRQFLDAGCVCFIYRLIADISLQPFIKH
jgi:hypothetical protein